VTETWDFKICAFYWNFSKNYHYHCKVEFFQISGIFPICFGCFLLTNTTEKKLVELQKFYKAISLQYWQFQYWQSCWIKKVVKFIDFQKLPSFYGPTIFHGCPYAQHAWYKQFNSNEILPNINLM